MGFTPGTRKKNGNKIEISICKDHDDGDVVLICEVTFTLNAGEGVL